MVMELRTRGTSATEDRCLLVMYRAKMSNNGRWIFATRRTILDESSLLSQIWGNIRARSGQPHSPGLILQCVASTSGLSASVQQRYRESWIGAASLLCRCDQVIWRSSKLLTLSLCRTFSRAFVSDARSLVLGK